MCSQYYQHNVTQYILWDDLFSHPLHMLIYPSLLHSLLPFLAPSHSLTNSHLSLSHSLSLTPFPLFLSLTHSLLSLSLSPSLSPSLSHSLSPSISLSPHLLTDPSLSLTLSLTPSLPLSLAHSLLSPANGIL